MTEHTNEHIKSIEPKSPAQYARIFFTGVAMGAADIVPGVSGGTMAFILGIYANLLNAIKSFNLEVVRTLLRFDLKGVLAQVPWRFLLALLLGIGTAIVTLVTGLEFALHNYPVFLFAFFTGLILASILAVSVNVKWNTAAVIAMLLTTVGAFLLVGLRPQQMSHHPLIMFVSGAIAICAMILPGISGSFLLLIMGQYEYVISSIRSLLSFENVLGNLITLGSLAIGCVVGIAGFSRFLSWLLKRYENVTVAALVGFMIGSIRVIYPFKAAIFDGDVLQTFVDKDGVTQAVTRNVLPWVGEHVENIDNIVRLSTTEISIAFGLALLGFVLVSLLDHLQSRRNPLFVLFSGNKAQPAPTSGD